MNREYDVAVIGGGPGGYSAAVKAAQLGAKVIVFEKEELGGTCLNVGCIPTKCLLEKAALIDKIRRNTENGLLKEAGLFSFRKIQEQKNAAVKRLTGGVGAILSSYGIDVVKGTAEVEEAGEVTAAGRTYTAENIIIASGSKAYIPPVKGADGKKIVTSTEALSFPAVPKRLAIIGGGVIGLEFASAYHTFGSEVTVFEMLENIVTGEDQEMVAILKRELQKSGIEICTGAEVEKIEDSEDGRKTVAYKCGERKGTWTADYVLMAVGRRPNTEGINIKELEKDSHGYIAVNRKMETNIPGIYAVGDAAGGYQLAHAAYAEAETAAENCMGKEREVNVDFMPRCIYCMPQLAAVGKTEEQLQKEGQKFRKALFPYSANGKALAAGEETGMVKVLTDARDGTILGVHIVGGYATELLSGALVAVNRPTTAEEFEDMIFPHPTMSELIKETVLAAEGRALHMPKVK